MGTHARIENDFIAIDTHAWLDQRTSGPLDDLTRDLHAWAVRHHPDAAPTTGGDALTDLSLDRQEWRQTVLAWCHARGHGSPDPDDPLAGPLTISHELTRLDRDVRLACALTPDGCRIVVAQIEDDAPVVYDDTTGEFADWFDADTVDIACPAGHGWTWRTGRELLTADGSFTTLTVVFGPNLDAPFTRCGDCTAYDTGQRPDPCGCDGTPWIVCPVPGCGRRCDVHLPGL